MKSFIKTQGYVENSRCVGYQFHIDSGKMRSLESTLLLCIYWCMLTSMSVGAPSDVTGFQSVEGYVIPPEESLNGTTSIGSRVPRRLPDFTRACQEIYVRLDPQTYFGTNDIFFPRFIFTIKCAGTPSSPPSCGSSTNCRMHCLTRMGRVTFLRRPSDPRLCMKRKQVVISDVPVGCYCV